MQIDSVIAPVLQEKFRFMGCLVKANALFSGNRSSLSSQLTGAQPEFFQGRGGFVKLGHFDKQFSKSHENRPRRQKFWSFFLLDTLKTTFLIVNSL